MGFFSNSNNKILNILFIIPLCVHVCMHAMEYMQGSVLSSCPGSGCRYGVTLREARPPIICQLLRTPARVFPASFTSLLCGGRMRAEDPKELPAG